MMSSPHASGDWESREDRASQDAESTAMQLRPWAELVPEWYSMIGYLF
jgi:hypothetical protein